MKIEQGDFYVIVGECMSCMLPESEAPDLISYNELEGHCYFKKQPENDKEIMDAIAVFDVSCCDAQRYCGTDKNIIALLISHGHSHSIVKE